MITTNLKVIDVPYIEENRDLLGKDWKSNQVRYINLQKWELNSDQELEEYLLKAIKMIEYGNEGHRFDYHILSFCIFF